MREREGREKESENKDEGRERRGEGIERDTHTDRGGEREKESKRLA